jgi:hypothetical protein
MGDSKPKIPAPSAKKKEPLASKQHPKPVAKKTNFVDVVAGDEEDNDFDPE